MICHSPELTSSSSPRILVSASSSALEVVRGSGCLHPAQPQAQPASATPGPSLRFLPGRRGSCRERWTHQSHASEQPRRIPHPDIHPPFKARSSQLTAKRPASPISPARHHARLHLVRSRLARGHLLGPRLARPAEAGELAPGGLRHDQRLAVCVCTSSFTWPLCPPCPAAGSSAPLYPGQMGSPSSSSSAFVPHSRARWQALLLRWYQLVLGHPARELR